MYESDYQDRCPDCGSPNKYHRCPKEWSVPATLRVPKEWTAPDPMNPERIPDGVIAFNANGVLPLYFTPADRNIDPAKLAHLFLLTNSVPND